jgi:L-alanine-DL-glutamate epimerase-like enolase superfamily enzyme
MERSSVRVSVISRASAQVIARESPATLNTSYADAADIRERVIVSLVTDDGVIGWGEASPLPFFTGERVASVHLQLEQFFLPRLIGRSPFELTAIMQDLDELPENCSAKAAIDIALHDLQGRLLGCSVCDLLGGAVRTRVPVTMPIGIEPVAAAVGKAEAAVARGIGTLKLKIGRDTAADIERVGAIRAAVGPHVRIRVDANAGYPVAVAIRLLHKLAAFDLEYVEQPVAGWDRAGLAEVRRATGLPIMADESLHSLRDAVELINRAAADLFAIKLIKTSGLAQARSIAALAAAHRIDVVVISPFETQIGAAAGLALALAAPTGNRAHELRVFDSQPETAETEIRVERGEIIPSPEPGLGVTRIVEVEVAAAISVPSLVS